MREIKLPTFLSTDSQVPRRGHAEQLKIPVGLVRVRARVRVRVRIRA